MRVDVAIIVGVYFLVLLGWNLRNFLKSRVGDAAEEEAYVGRRNFGTGALIATLVAVYASNYTLLAAAESGFKYGFSGPIWYALGVAVPLMFFIWPVNLIKRMRASMPRGVTLVEYYGVRYDERTRLAALIVVLIASIIAVVSGVVAIGIVLDSLLDIGEIASILIGGGVLIVYTALGGYEGTARSHVYQLIIAGLAVAVSIALIFHKVDLADFVHDLGVTQRDMLGWGPVNMLDFFLALTALAIANPILWQRMFSARDNKSATRSMAIFPWLWVPFAIGSGVMGMIAFHLIPGISPDQAATRLVVELFPTWAAVLFLLGGLALVFSSSDAAINNIASIVQFDVIGRYFGRYPTGRRAVYLSFGLQIGLGVIGMIGALGVQSILHLLIVNSAINIALLLPLVLGLIWRRADPRAAFWAIVLSLLSGAGLMIAGFGALGDLVALAVSACLMIGLSTWLPTHETPSVGARQPVAHAVSGVMMAVAVYTALFALASAFGGVAFLLPGYTLYPLMAYAFGGCLVLALVLPVVSLRKGRA